MKKAFFTFALGMFIVLSSGFTNPENKEPYPGDYTLFHIERSRDADVVMYDVNLDSQGKLDSSNPISVYWKKISGHGQPEPITMIQKKFGYGIKFKSITETVADFQLISYPDRTFQLRGSGNNTYRVYTISGDKEIELSSLYIQFEDNSFWFPTISRIELKGVDATFGEYLTETVTPVTRK